MKPNKKFSVLCPIDGPNLRLNHSLARKISDSHVKCSSEEPFSRICTKTTKHIPAMLLQRISIAPFVQKGLSSLFSSVIFELQTISSYSSKFHRIGRCPQIVILRPSDTCHRETPNPSNLGIDTDTALPLRHYTYDSP